MAAMGHRFPRITVIRIAGLLFSVALAGMAVVRQWWLAALLLGVTGCLMLLNNVATNTQLQTAAPDQLRGRVMGFYSLMVLGMSPFGSLQAGWVSEHYGVPAALGLGAVVCGLSMLWLAEPWGGHRKQGR